MVRGASIKTVVSVRNLGTHFDIHVSMRNHVDVVCKKCNFHLRPRLSLIGHSSGCFKSGLLLCPPPGYTRISLWWICIGCLSCNQRIKLIQSNGTRTHARTHARTHTRTHTNTHKAVHDLATAYLSEPLNERTRHPRLRQLPDQLQLALPPVSKSIGR